MRFRSLVIVPVIWILNSCSSGHTDDVQSRIAAVENNLLPAVVNAGAAPAGMALSDRMQHYQVPGVSIAIINSDRIEWAKGYGVTVSSGTQAVTLDTVFQACSVSKPVSVTGIMLLAQAGTIDIAKNVNDYLKSWRHCRQCVHRNGKTDDTAIDVPHRRHQRIGFWRLRCRQRGTYAASGAQWRATGKHRGAHRRLSSRLGPQNR